jgi:hypothetical protein
MADLKDTVAKPKLSIGLEADRRRKNGSKIACSIWPRTRKYVRPPLGIRTSADQLFFSISLLTLA